MVEINNQRKAFLDNMAWSEGLITDVRKPKSAVMTSLQAESYLPITRSPSQTCHAKPKTQINRRRTLPASFPLVGCAHRKQSFERLLSLKSQDAVVLCRLRSVALSPMIDR